jgi:hypothetical protein
MAPKGGKKRLPQRSVGAPVRLARRTCLRCSKRIAVEPDHRCGYKDYKKCGACARKHKECDPVSSSRRRHSIANMPQIPRKFVHTVNKLLELADKLRPDETGYDERLQELNGAQRRYTRRVQAYILKRDKHGLKHRPTNTVEASSLPVWYRND